MITTKPGIMNVRDVRDPVGVSNPYWNIVRKFPNSGLSFDGTWSPDGFGFDMTTYQRNRPSREDLVRRYAWAITDPLSVAFVAEHAPGGIIEIGAGAGYWAWQLAQRGTAVVAYDAAPPDTDENKYCQSLDAWRQHPARRGPVLRPTYYPVLRGSADMAARAPQGAALFLCWPPYQSSMAAEALAAYPGDTVILIGEPDGGCTADEDFFKALGSGWDEVAEHDPVQFGGIHDYITVHRRRAEAKGSA